MDIVYSRTRQPAKRGRTQINPRFFEAPVDGAKTVYIDGDYPKIEAAYASAGVKVLRLDGLVPPPAVKPAIDAEPVVIPADWRDLPWTQPDERGLTLRKVASDVSDGPVNCKAQAVAAIEAYLGVTTVED